MNLFEETNKVLKDHGKTWEEINWIGGNDFSISIENFIEVAKKTDYISEYDCIKIAYDLIIMGNGNWWLERNFEDGEEYWMFVQVPTKPSLVKVVTTLGGDDSESIFLIEMNEDN